MEDRPWRAGLQPKMSGMRQATSTNISGEGQGCDNLQVQWRCTSSLAPSTSHDTISSCTFDLHTHNPHLRLNQLDDMFSRPAYLPGKSQRFQLAPLARDAREIRVVQVQPPVSLLADDPLQLFIEHIDITEQVESRLDAEDAEFELAAKTAAVWSKYRALRVGFNQTYEAVAKSLRKLKEGPTDKMEIEFVTVETKGEETKAFADSVRRP